MTDREFYRPKEICAALGISERALRKKIAKGTLPPLVRRGVANSRIVGYEREKLLKILIAESSESSESS